MGKANAFERMGGVVAFFGEAAKLRPHGMASTTHIALLRGINVGKARRVGMADLRKLVAGLGFQRVRTVLNTGNVIFEAAESKSASGAAGAIERAMADRLGVRTNVTVISAAHLARTIERNPLETEAESDPTRFLVAFPRTPDDAKALQTAGKMDFGREKLVATASEAYLWCPDGVLGGKLGKTILTRLGDGVTTRNWATLHKIAVAVTASP